MKKILSLLLVGVIGALSFNDALASGTGKVIDGEGITPVELTTSAAAFNVVVPTSLPITIDASGIATYADEAKIKNLSHGAVEIKQIEVTGKNNWEIVAYDEASTTGMKVNAKEVGLSILGCETKGNSSSGEIFTVTSGTMVMTGQDTKSDNDELVVEYSASIAPQSTELTEVNIADVVFTIGWNEE